MKLFAIILLLTSFLMAKNLYVNQSTGKNTYSYEENSSQKPWATFAHGVYRVKAGDTLFICGGTYVQDYPIIIRWDYGRIHDGGDPNEQVLCESGTATKPIVIKNYDGNKVIIDCQKVNIVVDHDGRSYWKWEGLNFINANMVFRVGNNQLSNYNSFKNITIIRNRGGDNNAGITLVNGNAEHTIIQNCKLLGPGNQDGIHLNTCGIYLKAVEYVKILNNEISDVPIGIYFKHRNEGSSSTDIEIAYNHIKNTKRNSMNLNCNYAKIHDNIIGVGATLIANNNANGAPGGDYNIYEHNTFFGGGLALNPNTQSGDPLPGSINCTIRNNSFFSTVYIHNYSTLAHNTKMDYNAYNTGVVIKSGQSNMYSLSQWKTFYGQSQHDIQGTISLIVNGTPQKTEDFALATNSIGYKTASDGEDMGVNINSFLGEVSEISQIPEITGDSLAKVQIGDSFYYSIEASNYPDVYYAQNLPEGLVIDSLNGVIKGIPQDTGKFKATLKAKNNKGSSKPFNLTFVISQLEEATYIEHPKALKNGITSTGLHKLIYNSKKGMLNVYYSLEFNRFNRIEFELFDLSGKIVWKKDLSSPQCGFNMLESTSKLSQGSYIFRMRIHGEHYKPVVLSRRLSVF